MKLSLTFFFFRQKVIKILTQKPIKLFHINIINSHYEELWKKITNVTNLKRKILLYSIKVNQAWNSLKSSEHIYLFLSLCLSRLNFNIICILKENDISYKFSSEGLIQDQKAVKYSSILNLNLWRSNCAFSH